MTVTTPNGTTHPLPVTPVPAFPSLLALMFYLWFCDIRIPETDSQFWRVEPVKSRCWHLVWPFTFLTWRKSVGRGRMLGTCLAVERRRAILLHKLFRSCTSSLLTTHLSSLEMCLFFLVLSLSSLEFPHSTLKSSLSVLHSQSLLGLGLPLRFYFCSVDRQNRQMSVWKSLS